MSYKVKEIFCTLQGEGGQAGRVAVFLRFSGCNLWSGRDQDRAKATCRFCDTDFVGTDGTDGGTYPDAETLAAKVASFWPKAERAQPYVVCTGGEPLLQLDQPLIRALHEKSFEIAIESNGTLPAPVEIDWICISPKAGTTLKQTMGSELKLVFPQADAMPEMFESLLFDRFYLQPMDGPDRAANTAAAIAYCMAHPQWRLSLQNHKLIGIR